MPFTYIAGDVGGTNCRLHLYRIPEKGDEEQIEALLYSSQSHSSLSSVVIKFLSEIEFEGTPDCACFSLAGPVKNGEARLTNIGWEMSESEVSAELNIPIVIFVNDFAACGYGIKLLQKDELYELSNKKTPTKYGPKVIIGAGTGLGEAYIFEDENKFTVVPGEGGHSDFAPRNKTEFDLMCFIKNKLNLSRVGVERVVSGPGLEQIYWFFVSTNKSLENTEVSNEILGSKQPGMIISKLAVDKEDVICEKALKLFISCYGAETGNMGLSILPSGGIYIAGGIAPQIRDMLHEGFLDSLYDKGRMRKLLCAFPIYVVMNTNLGILGARYLARLKIGEKNTSITRNLSIGDIRSLSTDISLLSEEPKNFTLNRANSNLFEKQIHPENYDKKWSSKALPSVYQNQKREGRKKEKSQAVTNALFMCAGVGFSGLLLAAFLFGRRSRE